MWLAQTKLWVVQIEERVSHYEYITTTSGRPLQLHMLGAELALDSHFDEYILDFKAFEKLDEEDESPFAVPANCQGIEARSGPRPFSLLLASLIPQVCPALLLICLGST